MDSTLASSFWGVPGFQRVSILFGRSEAEDMDNDGAFESLEKSLLVLGDIQDGHFKNKDEWGDISDEMWEFIWNGICYSKNDQLIERGYSIVACELCVPDLLENDAILDSEVRSIVCRLVLNDKSQNSSDIFFDAAKRHLLNFIEDVHKDFAVAAADFLKMSKWHCGWQIFTIECLRKTLDRHGVDIAKSAAEIVVSELIRVKAPFESKLEFRATGNKGIDDTYTAKSGIFEAVVFLRHIKFIEEPFILDAFLDANVEWRGIKEVQDTVLAHDLLNSVIHHPVVKRDLLSNLTPEQRGEDKEDRRKI